MSLVLRAVDPLLPLRAGLAVADVAGPARGSSGRTTCCSTAASSPACWWRRGRRTAGRCSASASTCDRSGTLPEDVRARAATLGRPPAALEPTLDELLRALEARLAEPAAATLCRAAGARRARGDGPSAGTGGRGAAAGIAGDGALSCARPAARPRLDAGEVHLRRDGRARGVAPEVLGRRTCRSRPARRARGRARTGGAAARGAVREGVGFTPPPAATAAGRRRPPRPR